MIWEGMNAAANASFFPEQLDGPTRARDVAGQEDLLRRQHAGTGGTTTAADCTTGFTPGRDEQRHGRRRLDGLRLAVLWPRRQRPGTPAGLAEDLGAGRRRGLGGVPDAEPHDEQGHVDPGCSRFGRRDACRSSRTRTPRPARTTRSSTAPRADPGGLPVGTLEYLTFDRFYNVAGQPFEATLHLKALGGAIPAGTAQLTVPAGWTVDAAEAAPAPMPRARRRRRPSRSRRARRRDGARTSRSPPATRGSGDRLHGQRRPDRPGRRRPLPPLGQVGRVRLVARRTSRRRRTGSAARPPSSRWASARRSTCRSTCTTGRRRRRAAT